MLHIKGNVEPCLVLQGEVMLQFLSLSLEVHVTCDLDSVTLHCHRHGEHFSQKSCGETIPPEVACDDEVTVSFRTDFSITGNGFKLAWQSKGKA